MRRYAVLLTALAALTACTGDGSRDAAPAPTPVTDSASDSAAATAQPAPPAPEPGRCYRLRFRDALASTTDRPPVPCRERHTSVTTHVGRLDLVAQGRPFAVTHPRVQRQAATACSRRLAPWLGGTPELVRRTMFAAVWFTPDATAAHAGSRWFRCDVIALGPERSLLALPRDLEGVLAEPAGRERFAMCGTASPDDPRFRRVVCSVEHAWRAVATVDLPGDRYPSPEQFSARMDGPCRDAAREAADDPLDFRWTEERPTRWQWRAGQRHGICWAPD